MTEPGTGTQLDTDCHRCGFERVVSLLSSDEENEEDDISDAIDASLYVPIPRPLSINQFQSFWKTTNPQLTASMLVPHAYGEATAGTLFKLWSILQIYVPLVATDVLLDWGAGAGKMLCSKFYFSPFPQMRAIGFEMDEQIYAGLKRNIDRLPVLGRQTLTIAHRDSTTVTAEHWTALGVTIALQYDGGPQAHLEEYHKTIMTSLFHSPTVRCVFSTKMNLSLFMSYFDTDPVVRTSWRLVRVGGLLYGKSAFIGNLWIKNV
jgi:hypothetical protein